VRSVEFHPDDQNELISAAQFYERQTEGLGLDFIVTVQRTYERLPEFPRSGASTSSRSCTFTGGHAIGGLGSDRRLPDTRSTGPLARLRSPRPCALDG
jgi:hypothetical protein